MINEPAVSSVAYGILASFVDPSSMTLLGGGYLSVGWNHDLGSVQVTMTDEQRGLVEVVHFWPVSDDVVQALLMVDPKLVDEAARELAARVRAAIEVVT